MKLNIDDIIKGHEGTTGNTRFWTIGQDGHVIGFRRVDDTPTFQNISTEAPFEPDRHALFFDDKIEAAQAAWQLKGYAPDFLEHQPQKEMVLRIGLEGGGTTIYRMPLASGGWQFFFAGSSMFLDENDDDYWRHWSCGPFPSIEEALRAISSNDDWVIFYPSVVHPEYRKQIWEMAEAAVRKHPERLGELWNFQRPEWRRACCDGESW